MHEAQNPGFDDYQGDQAQAALTLARAYYAGVALAARHRPGDPSVQRRLQEAVEQGRGAWKAYQIAATAGLAHQLADSVPTAFREAAE